MYDLFNLTGAEGCCWAVVGRLAAELRPWEDFTGSFLFCFLAVGQNQWYHFGWYVNSPPILEPILVVRIGMFTGGTIWILTHGRVRRRP